MASIDILMNDLFAAQKRQPNYKSLELLKPYVTKNKELTGALIRDGIFSRNRNIQHTLSKKLAENIEEQEFYDQVLKQLIAFEPTSFLQVYDIVVVGKLLSNTKVKIPGHQLIELYDWLDKIPDDIEEVIDILFNRPESAELLYERYKRSGFKPEYAPPVIKDMFIF